MNASQRLAKDGFFGVEPVLFYGHKGTDWPYFSNFSRHGLHLPSPWTYETVFYPTGEHRYQAMKADNKVEHDWVVAAEGPGESKHRGRAVSLRQPWGETYGTYAYYVMLETVLAKASEHPAVMRSLLKTMGRPIYEDSPTDDIWGWRLGPDHRGKNLLGTCWMQARYYVA